MKNTKNRAVIGVLLLVSLFFGILMIFAWYTMSIFSQSTALDLGSGSNKGSIAVVEINGVIISAKKTIEKIHKAAKDKKIKAIIIRINSPGGSVGPTQEVYEEIRRIDTDKENGKPIYASFGSVAASGGYYIGAATRKIYSNGGTLTGSIGVIMQFMDLSKLYEFAKVKPEIVKSGKYKDVGSPARAMKPAERKKLEALIKNVHKQFIRDIAKTRGKRIKGDLEKYAQGQIFSGEDAYNKGLVDEIAGLWEAGRRIHKELKLESKFGLKFIKLKKKSSFTKLFEDIESIVENINLESFSFPQLMFK